MKFAFGFFLAAISCSLVTTASAQSVITWNPSVDLIAGGNDNTDFISQTGAFVVGFNGGTTADPVTIGDSVFQAATAAQVTTGVTANGVTVTGTFANDTGGGTFGSGEFVTATSDTFGNLLSSGVFDGNDGSDPVGPGSVSFTGLTDGNQYEIQVLTNDARGGTNAGIRDNAWQVGFTDGVNTTIAGISELTNRPANDSASTAVTGDFIIGNFTASGTTQSFNIAATRAGFTLGDELVQVNGGQSQFNAFQLRDVSPSIVPEPSSLALLGLAGLGMVTRRRRN